MILQLLKYALFGDERQQPGHPVHLLLITFQRHVNVSSVALLNEMKELLPPIQTGTYRVLQKAEQMYIKFHDDLKNSQYDLNTPLSDDEKKRLTEIAETYQTAIKMSPYCIATRLRYLQFNIRNCNWEFGNIAYNQVLSLLDENYDFHTNPNTPGLENENKDAKHENDSNTNTSNNSTNSGSTKSKKKSKSKKKHSKQSKRSYNWSDAGLNNMQKERLIRLIMFYMSYLYSMTSKYQQGVAYLKQAVSRDKNDLSIRVSYCLSKIMASNFDTSWEDMVAVLKDIETYEIEHNYFENLEAKHREQLERENLLKEETKAESKNNGKKNKRNKKRNNSKEMLLSSQDCKMYKLYLHIACAALILSQSEVIEWNLVVSHLERALTLDSDNSNQMLYYVMSYAYYNAGKQDAAKVSYSKFKHFVENDFKKQWEDHDHSECGHDHSNDDAHSHGKAPSMDAFSWKPQVGTQQVIETVLDAVIALVVLAAVDYMLGFRPHLGDNLIDWGFIAVAFIIVLFLTQSPGLAIFCLGIGLPPFYGMEKQDDGTKIYAPIEFDYKGSVIKLVTVLTTLMAVNHFSGLKKLKF